MADEERDEEQERRRPRVVDRRISSRAAAEGAAPPREPAANDPGETAAPSSTSTAEAVAPSSTPTGDAGSPVSGAPTPEGSQPAPEEPIWTPEQEAEARKMVEQISQVPSRDWVADAAIRLANVAGVKLDGGDPAEAQLAIDALAGLVNAVGQHLGDAETPLRQMLAQLQMAFAQSVTPPPQGG